MAQGQPILPEPGPLYDAAEAQRFRAGQRPFATCSWCGTSTRLSLTPSRNVVCPHCDR